MEPGSSHSQTSASSVPPESVAHMAETLGVGPAETATQSSTGAASDDHMMTETLESVLLDSEKLDTTEQSDTVQRAKRKRDEQNSAAEFMSPNASNYSNDTDFIASKRPKVAPGASAAHLAALSQAASSSLSAESPTVSQPADDSRFEKLVAEVAVLSSGVKSLLTMFGSRKNTNNAQNISQSTSRPRMNVQPPATETPAASETAIKPTEPSPTEKIAWARLISQYTGKEIKIIGTAGASFTIRDESKSAIGTVHICSGKLVLEVTSGYQIVSVNGSLVRRGERVTLLDGDEIAFETPSKKRSEFFYQQLATPPNLPAHSCPSEASQLAQTAQAAQMVQAAQAARRRQMASAGAMPNSGRPTNTPGTIELRLDGQPVASVDLPPLASSSKFPLPPITAMIEAQAKMHERNASSSSVLGGAPCDPLDIARELIQEAMPANFSRFASRDRERASLALASDLSDLVVDANEPVSVGSLPAASAAAADSVAEPSVSPSPSASSSSEDQELIISQTRKLVDEVIPSMFRTPEQIGVTFDNFPYFLSDSLRQVLINSTHLFLQEKEDLASKYVPESVKSVSRRLLLVGQHGTELYQDSLVQALGKLYSAVVVTIDENTFAQLDRGVAEMKDAKPSASSASSTVDVEVTASCCAEPTASITPDAMDVDTPAQTTAASVSATAKTGAFKVGDRIRYIGGSSTGSDTERLYKLFCSPSKSTSSSSSAVTVLHPPPSELGSIPGIAILRRAPSPTHAGQVDRSSEKREPSRMPPYGATGTVALVLGTKRIGVKFDQSFPGAIPLSEICEEKLCQFVAPADISPETESSPEPGTLLLEQIFQQINQRLLQGEKIILHVRRLEKTMLQRFTRFVRFKTLLDDVKGQVVAIAGACSSHIASAPSHGEKESHRSSHGMVMYSRGSGGLDIIDQIQQIRGAITGSGSEASNSAMANKLINTLFPTRIVIHPPEATPQQIEWEKRLEQDTKKLRSDQNIMNLRAALQKHGFDCSAVNPKPLGEKIFSTHGLEKLVGYVLSDHIMKCARLGLPISPAPGSGKMEISPESIDSAITMLRHSKPQKKRSILETATENTFEKQLLGDVIPPNDIGVRFDDIGALDTVKDTLRELVMLPLQRPELFRRGNLAKPCRGVLLFGPPGTGKTMLAKAVATESGANFINISMASVGSKWFGEGEKYARAVFTLASKLAPSVIFIDEVDAILGRRDKSGEHEAMRKIKNEMMMMWDGLKSMEGERVLVLAATNRPMDLDDAVLRRLPRRILVDLPDAANRKKILKVLLMKEDLATSVDLDELANMTDGFTGSDMKNLCVAAAYHPIRELIASEKAGAASAQLRSLQMSDFKKAASQVRPSVSEDAVSISELRKWNDAYGEGGNRGKVSLPYFM